MNIPR